MRDTSFDAEELETVRRAFARQITTIAGVGDNRRIAEAFASVKREDFLGAGPWLMRGVIGAKDYLKISAPDPVLAYQDLLFGLQPDRKVNTGQPSLHAKWLSALDPAPGARVVHIGAGAGYYTAILSRLVGEAGHVTGVEYDPDLAETARRNLSTFHNVSVVQDDGATWPKQEVDAIYVNFGVPRPASAWLDGLAMSGRLILPFALPAADQLTGAGQRSDQGAGFCITRDLRGFTARWLGPCWIVCAEGSLSISIEEANRLRAILPKEGMERVRRLHWREAPQAESSWFVGSDWSLSTAD